MKINEKKLDLYPAGYEFESHFSNTSPNSIKGPGSFNFVYNRRNGQYSDAPQPTSWQELLSLQGVKFGGEPRTDVTGGEHFRKNDGIFPQFGEAHGLQIDWDMLKDFIVGSAGQLRGRLCIAVFNNVENMRDCMMKLVHKHPEFGQNPEEVVVKPGTWRPLPLSSFLQPPKVEPYKGDFIDHNLNLNFKEWLRRNV